MIVKEQISIENFQDKKFKISVLNSKKDTEADFTHYLHNYKNGVSDAVPAIQATVKKIIEKLKSL